MDEISILVYWYEAKISSSYATVKTGTSSDKILLNSRKIQNNKLMFTNGYFILVVIFKC